MSEVARLIHKLRGMAASDISLAVGNPRLAMWIEAWVELDYALSKGADPEDSWARAIVYVHNGAATCGKCGGSASPSDEYHEHGGTPNTPLTQVWGCRARFVKVVELSDVDYIDESSERFEG